MLTFKGLAEFIGFLVFYDLVLKESIIKPLVVEFTQSKVRRYLPYFMQYLDGQVYKAVSKKDATVLDSLMEFKYDDLTETENQILRRLAIEKYNPLVFLEKLNQDLEYDELIESELRRESDLLPETDSVDVIVQE